MDAAALRLLEGEDLGLAAHAGAVFKGGLQLDIGVGHRQHPPCDGENLAHPGNSLIEGVGNAVQRRQQQISESLPRQAAPPGKR